MPITQDRLAKLRLFGLSEYAARAYLALLDLGTAEARDVSSISKVPQAKIYHVLEQLHEKGLVVILPEFPKKYVPVPFEDYLNRLFDEHTKAAESIDAERDSLAEMFAVVGDTDVGNRGFFTVIRGRRNVLSKIEEMIHDTKRDLVILGTTGMAGRASHMAPELSRARERGVRVRVLAPIDEETLPRLAKLAQHADIRARDLVEETPSRKVAIVVSDGARAFLIHFVPDDSNLYAGKDIGVFTDQEAMVAAIQAIVEPHWASATDLNAKRAQIEEGREPEFARVYTSADDAERALAQAVERGAREVLGVVAYPMESAAEVAPVFERVGQSGGRVRALLNISSLEAADAVGALCASVAGGEARHLAPRLVARQWVIDEREAFFAIAGKADGSTGIGPEMIIHTNNRAVIQSMRSHFDLLWRGALSLNTRRQELELFPHLQPAELGLGVLFSQIEDAVIVCDGEGKILLWNPASVRVFGRRPQEAMGLRVTRLAEDRHVEALERAFRRVHAAPLGSEEARKVVETACTRPDGEEREVEWLISPIVDPMRGRLVLCIGRDVTDAKRAREAEARSAAQVIRVYERMTEAFYALDRDFRFVYRNPITKQMQSIMTDEQIDRHVLWDVFPDLKETKFYTEFTRAMREMVPVQFEEHYPRMDRWFEVNAYPSEDGLSVYFRDVTSRRRAEEQLRAREEQLAQAELLAHMGSWSWEVAENRVRWSAGLHRVFGVSDEAVASYEAWLEHVHPDDRERASSVIARALTDHQPFEFHHRTVRPDGEVRTLLSRGIVVVGEHKQVAKLVGIALDVTGQVGNVPVLDHDAAEARTGRPRARK